MSSVNITNLYHTSGLHAPERGTQYAKGAEPKTVNPETAFEHWLEVYINKEPYLSLMCSPELLPELVLGRLCTDGLIASAAEVESVHIDEDGGRAEVTLLGELREAPPMRPVKGMEWKREWIYAIAARFEHAMPAYAATKGTHSCILAVRDRILYCCEDLGRHNTMDKVVGCAIRDGVDLTEAIVYSSGRIPTDMAAKAIRAGVPVLASKTVPTDRAIAMAREYGLTLISPAGSSHLVVY